MSGTFRPAELPDLGATLARMAQIDATRQQTALARQQLEQDQAFTRGLGEVAPALATGQGSEYSAALSRLVGLGPRGLQIALPALQQERESALIRDALRGPTAPAMAAPQPQAAATGDYQTRLVGMESGGDPNARNPRSSATGTGQFIDGTWLQFAQAHPDLFQGMTRDQILAARNNPELSRRAIEWYRQSNAASLQGQGLPANDGTAALAHRFGPQGAAALLRADQNAPIDGVVGQQVMAANPDLAGRTVGQVVQQYAQRFGSAAASPQQAPGGQAAAAQGNPYAAQIARLVATGHPRALALAAQLSQIGQRESPRMTEVRTNEGVFLVDPTNPSNRVRLGGIPETAPRTPERFEQDRALAEAGAARSQTTVNAGDRRTDTLVADAWNTAEQNVQDAGRRSVLLRRAESAIGQFPPGIMADRRVWLGQVARELGVRSPSTSEGEVLQQVQRQLELAATPRGQGAITENERALIRQAVPVFLSTPEGARAAIGLIRRLDDYEGQVARIYRENARRNGGSPDPVTVRAEIADFVAQNQPPDVQAVIDQFSAPQQPPAQGGVQAEPPQPAQAARPRARNAQGQVIEWNGSAWVPTQ